MHTVVMTSASLHNFSMPAEPCSRMLADPVWPCHIVSSQLLLAPPEQQKDEEQHANSTCKVHSHLLPAGLLKHLKPEDGADEISSA